MAKIKLLNKLYGDVPCVYKRTTIYNMCVLINALVDRVNYLVNWVEKFEQEKANG